MFFFFRYYKEITESIIGSKEKSSGHQSNNEDIKLRNEAISSLTHSTGIHQLLPRFIAFFHEGIKCNVTNFNSQNSDRPSSIAYYRILGNLLKMVEALNLNVNISLEDYIHEILPGLFTCCLSNKVVIKHYNKQFHAREFSAKLISSICKCYSSSSNMLEVRITSQCEKVIRSPNSSIHSLYGSIYLLIKLGEDTMEHFIHLVKLVFEKTKQEFKNNENFNNNNSISNNNNPNISAEIVTAKEMDRLVFSGCASSSEGLYKTNENIMLPILVKIYQKGRLERCGKSVEEFEEFFGERFGSFVYNFIFGGSDRMEVN